MARVALDIVPDLGRPDAVSRAVEEARQLRGRAREAQEALAAAQAALDEAEKRDVEAAAARARAGEALGATPGTVKKAREAVEIAQRASAVLALALEDATDDLAEAIVEHGNAWISACNDAEEAARESGSRAIDALSESIAQVRASASAALWVETSARDQRFDLPRRSMLVGSVAPSSRRLTANSEPLSADAILSFAHELLGESAAAPAPQAVTFE